LHPGKLLLEMNAADAEALTLRDDQQVRVISRRGEVAAWVRVTSTVRAGQVFLPMHDPGINRVTLGVFDPVSRQPGYKACAVRIERGGFG